MAENTPTLPKVSCIKTTENSIHTRRCFITGEYCSQQTNIQKERQKLHRKIDKHGNTAPEINAFVVMNFSSISDVVYESKIKPFIKGLHKYLYLDTKSNRIACVSTESVEKNNEETIAKNNDGTWKPVSKIHVHRADSNPVSNYIICNRICQQMQMADLVIVDVSVESANIFYEFGLATAFHKLILPICFSGSYYKMEYPEKLATAIQKAQAKFAQEEHDGKSEMDKLPKKLEKHIDCFPWRRKLFEHFGIRRQKDRSLKEPDPYIDNKHLPKRYDGVRYLKYQLVTLEQYGFSDKKYNRFPYGDKIKINGNDETVGSLIYSWLQKSFNCACDNTSLNDYNTLIVYTMDRIEDMDQAGQCIINFYNNITKPMWEKHCFCGDRVAILGQENHVWDDPKDNRKGLGLPYNVGDLIRLGMDEATYQAECKRIKTEDYLNPFLLRAPPQTQPNEVENQVKSHIRNRAFLLNPDTPIYVSYLKDGIQKSIPEKVVNAIASLDRLENNRYFFCLYHVMLDTLRYSNEIVVDLSSNSIQSLFWLGAAHGSDIYTVTVRHEMTEQEVSWSQDQRIKKDRTILDISGLWTAMFRRDETANFYKQLELIQLGIDQHARLKLPETELESFEEETLKQLYTPLTFFKRNNEDASKNSRIDKTPSYFKEKNRAESRALESYYRDRFWRQMHRDNQLHLFLDLQHPTQNDDPKSMTSKWDLDAIAELTQYLSKRKVISRYQIDTLNKDCYYGSDSQKTVRSASVENFIIIGSAPKPLQFNVGEKNEARSLSEYINEQNNLKESQQVFKYEKDNKICTTSHRSYEIRSFSKEAKDSTETYHVQFLPHSCIFDCKNPSKCIDTAKKIENATNEIFQKSIEDEKACYLLPAQLLLWREEQKGSGGYKYHVSLCGASGPATKALTALWVDEEQKWGIWGSTSDSLSKDLEDNLFRYLPLNTLQAHIRNKFYKELRDKINNVDQNAKKLSLTYLSTVLPQYFLPFLSKADEKRIYHGMEAFLLMSKIEDSERILEALEEILYQFRGVDALYSVSVSVSSNASDTDDRSITDIRLLKKSNSDDGLVINCLYVTDPPKKDAQK